MTADSTKAVLNAKQFGAMILKWVAGNHALQKGATVLAISGNDCAGKSTLARAVADSARSAGVRSAVISIDDYLIPAAKRPRRPPEHIGYFEDAFDYRALVSDIERITIAQDAGLMIVEGVFLLRRELRPHWDFSVWLAADNDLVIARAIHRDVYFFGSRENVQDVYAQRCIPAQAFHHDRDRPESFASLVAKSEANGWSVLSRSLGTT